MYIHNYDRTTKEYLSSELADIDPLDKDNFIIPAYATTIAPPKKILSKNMCYIFNIDISTWTAVFNYTKERLFDKQTGFEIQNTLHICEVPDLDKYTTSVPDFSLNNGILKYDSTTDTWIADIEESIIVEKRKAIFKIQKELNDLDIKKMRYLIEKASGNESGKIYFEQHEAQTAELREELKKYT